MFLKFDNPCSIVSYQDMEILHLYAIVGGPWDGHVVIKCPNDGVYSLNGDKNGFTATPGGYKYRELTIEDFKSIKEVDR